MESTSCKRARTDADLADVNYVVAVYNPDLAGIVFIGIRGELAAEQLRILRAAGRAQWADEGIQAAALVGLEDPDKWRADTGDADLADEDRYYALLAKSLRAARAHVLAPERLVQLKDALPAHPVTLFTFAWGDGNESTWDTGSPPLTRAEAGE